jgi:hypothetical protein
MTNDFTLYYNKCSCCGRSDSLHLGLSAVGWRFLFQKIPDKAENIQQWKELTAKGEITDEYGKVWDYKDFWDFVESKQHDRSQGSEHIDGYDFEKREFS